MLLLLLMLPLVLLTRSVFREAIVVNLLNIRVLLLVLEIHRVLHVVVEGRVPAIPWLDSAIIAHLLATVVIVA